MLVIIIHLNFQSSSTITSNSSRSSVANQKSNMSHTESAIRERRRTIVDCSVQLENQVFYYFK